MCFIAIIAISFLLPFSSIASAETPSKQRVYDFAEILTSAEKQQLEELAEQRSVERETDFIILTTKEKGPGRDVKKFMQDFYDEKGLGFDKRHGNAAIITIDIEDPLNREVYLAGFYKGEKYLNDKRLDLINDQIVPYLSAGQYYEAFETFIETANEYMGIAYWISPNSVLFEWWFQLAVSVGLAAIIVGIMLSNSGGKVTVNERTYRDTNTSKVLSRRDQYIRTTVTKVRKPTNNNRSGGGGGGFTSGGHSHSGSKRSF